MLELDVQASARFAVLQERLADRPDKPMEEVWKLTHGVVDARTAAPDDAWEMIWPKPLFANRRISVGETWTEAVHAATWANWRCCGLDGRSARFTPDVTPPRRANDAWSVHDDPECQVVNLGPPLHRLWQIQNAAAAFRAWCDASPETPVAFFAEQSLATLVVALKTAFGPFWGHTTVLHVLTDFGLAVKPDVHVVRSARHIGAAFLPAKKNHVDSLTAVALTEVLKAAVGPCGALAPHLPAALTTPAARMRYVDGVLLHADRAGLVPR